jgi:predicted nucleic-acid-binding Zn-ribbon protein
MSGGFFSSLFDVQGKKFVTAECDNCGYTEFYKRTSSTAGKILDFFTN